MSARSGGTEKRSSSASEAGGSRTFGSRTSDSRSPTPWQATVAVARFQRRAGLVGRLPTPCVGHVLQPPLQAGLRTCSRRRRRALARHLPSASAGRPNPSSPAGSMSSSTPRWQSATSGAQCRHRRGLTRSSTPLQVPSRRVRREARRPSVRRGGRRDGPASRNWVLLRAPGGKLDVPLPLFQPHARFVALPDEQFFRSLRRWKQTQNYKKMPGYERGLMGGARPPSGASRFANKYRNEIARMRKEGIVDLGRSHDEDALALAYATVWRSDKGDLAGWARSPWSRTLSARRTTCSTVSSPCRSWPLRPVAWAGRVLLEEQFRGASTPPLLRRTQFAC